MSYWLESMRGGCSRWLAAVAVIVALGIIPAAHAQVCGDATCDPGEDCDSCEEDCGTCASNCAQPPDHCQLPDQTGHGPPPGTVGATSDANIGSGIFVADNFQPTESGIITSVCWWGFYVNFTDGVDCGPGTGDQFKITYFENDLGDSSVPGLPGAVIGGPFVVSSSKIITGQSIPSGIGPITEYEYTATHAAVAVTAGDCYWIEIQNFTSGDCFWLWSTAPAGDNRGMQDDETSGDPLDGYDAGDGTGYDMAFCLSVGIEPDGACPPPANDDCADATVLIDVGSNNYSANYDLLYSTGSGLGEAGCIDPQDLDVWYVMTAPCDGEYLFTSLGLGVVAVYDFVCPTFSNDAVACGVNGSVTMVGGIDYYFRVAVPFIETDLLAISGPECIPVPANDDCGGAQTANDGDPFSTVGATNSGPDEAGCGGSAEVLSDTWYRWWSADCDETVTISASGDFTTKLAVYPSCPGATPDTALDCGEGSVTFTASPSTLYRFRVGSGDGSTGTGTLSIVCGPAAGCPGDTNGDNLLNIDDIVNAVICFGQHGVPDCAGPGTTGDIDDGSGTGGPDGLNNIDDIVYAVLRFGQSCP